MIRCIRLKPKFYQLKNHEKYLSSACSRLYSASAQPDPEKVALREKVERFGYSITEVADVPDYNATAILLKHVKTGAEHLHVERDDQNNVFSVAFRTTPFDSTGVPHILEHTVLCGSERYPVRDPFFKMLNRSLSTFMNAMTASDWTLYPFSTQNPKDFSNLMSVYLDAAFFPKLNEVDFRQEGWRLEPSDLNDPTSDVIFKGVVFNEMKGALSDAESIFARYLQSILLPSHTYGHESGGDPLHIPSLTYDDLKKFHETHYHPSNAKFYTYGNFPLESHLRGINEHVLNKFGKINPGTEIPIEPRWTEPRISTITCPIDPMAPDQNKQCMVAVSFMLDYTEDPFESFVLMMISTLLVSGPNSPFYQALIQPNIGSNYSPGLGLDSQTKNPKFSVGLQGVGEQDIDDVVKIIEETFQKVYEDGFDMNRVESILHNIELRMKHQSSNFGLGLIMAITSAWNLDKNPLKLLEINKHVGQFQKKLKESPDFLREKFKECFLDNTHKLTLVMKPDVDYSTKKDQAEAEILSKKLKNLSKSDIDELRRKGIELEVLQNTEEDLSVLPKMRVEDIEKEIRRTELNHYFIENVAVQETIQPTNGVTYFRAITTTSSIPYILKPYLPLFSHVLTKVGAANRTYKELAHEIELTTGGIKASTHILPQHDDCDSFEQGIMLSSHCLERNIPNMFSLCQDIVNEPTFDNLEWLKTLINGYANDLSSSVLHSGHLYAILSASKNLSPTSQLGELLGGISQVEFMKKIVENNNEDLNGIVENLMKIGTYLLNVNEMRCSLNTTEECMELATEGLEEMLSSLNVVGFDDEVVVEDADFIPRSRKVYHDMGFPVNFVARSVRAVTYSHEDFAKLTVLARLMSSKFLHREIREKGGAYGSGAKISEGIFSFYSYRDPNSLKTLEVFSAAVDWIYSGDFKEEDIEEAKLSIFSSIDSPVSPGNRGMALFQQKLTDELRQQNRERLFTVQKDSIVDVAERYLLPGKQTESYSIIGGSNEMVEKDSTWKVLKSE